MQCKTLNIVVLTAALSVSLAQGMVVCVGSGGHVAIETADHHHCSMRGTGESFPAHRDSLADAPPALARGTHDHFRRCTDIPIAVGVWWDRPLSSVAQASPLAQPCPRLAVSSATVEPLCFAHQELSSLRSVILLV